MKLKLLFFFLLAGSIKANSQSLLISNSVQDNSARESLVDLAEKYLVSTEYSIRCDSIQNCAPTQPIRLIENPESKKLSDNIVGILIDRLSSDYRHKIETSQIQLIDLLKDCDTLQNKQARLYYWVTNLSIIIDTSLTNAQRRQLHDEGAVIAGDVQNLRISLNFLHQEVLHKQMDIQRLVYDTSEIFPRIKGEMESYKTEEKYNELAKDLNDNFPPYFERQGNSIKKSLKSLDTLLVKYSERYNKNIIGKYFTKAEETKKVSFGALPALNSVIGSNQVNPSIAIHGFGSFTNADKSQYFELKLFTGTLSNDFPVVRTLFIPETSTWGASGKYTLGFVPVRAKNDTIQSLGLNLEFHYLSKKLKADTSSESKTFTPGIIHLRGGMEKILVKNLLSAYVNINAISIVDHIDKINEAFNQKKDILGFVDCGFKMLLTTDQINTGGLKLLVDLGAIINGGDVKQFIQSEDKIIPTIRIGLRKDFN